MLRLDGGRLDAFGECPDKEDYPLLWQGVSLASPSPQGIWVSLGAIVGGQVAAWLGIRYIFFLTSALLLINAVWVYFYLYKKLESKAEEKRDLEVREERSSLPL